MSNLKSKKFFEVSSIKNQDFQNDDLNSLKEKVKLEFSIQNSSKGVYSISAKLFDEQNLDFVSESKESSHEVLLRFEKFFVCDYYFERQQNLQIIINKNSNPITINTTMGCIIGARRSTYSFKFDGNETLIIKGEKIGKDDGALEFKFQLKENGNDHSSKCYY